MTIEAWLVMRDVLGMCPTDEAETIAEYRERVVAMLDCHDELEDRYGSTSALPGGR